MLAARLLIERGRPMILVELLLRLHICEDARQAILKAEIKLLIWTRSEMHIVAAPRVGVVLLQGELTLNLEIGIIGDPCCAVFAIENLAAPIAHEISLLAHIIYSLNDSLID